MSDPSWFVLDPKWGFTNVMFVLPDSFFYRGKGKERATEQQIIHDLAHWSNEYMNRNTPPVKYEPTESDDELPHYIE